MAGKLVELSKKDLIRVMRMRTDGWQNLMSLLGTARDRKTHLSYAFPGRMDQILLNGVYRGEGFAKKVIDIPVHNMIREWFKVDGDTDGTFQKVYKKIKFRKYLEEHLRWDRLHGGSVLVFGLDDGGRFHEPVKFNRLKAIRFMKVYDRWSVFHNVNYRDGDMNSINYGEFEYYDIQPSHGVPFVVHRDRLHILDGIDISERERESNEGWGDSVLQSTYPYIRSLANIYSNVESIIEDFIQTILKIDNLQNLISMGREELVKKRMEIIDMGRSLINTVLLDSKEDYSKVSSQVSGIEKLMQEYCLALSAVSNIPVTLLMGRSPAGMNSTGESDLTAFYDWISSLQEEKMLDVIDRTNYIITQCSEYVVNTKEPIITFNPLWQPTEEETVKSRKAQAEIDTMYLDRGVLTAQEVRDSRFGGETYSYDTVVEGDIEPDDRTLNPEDDNELTPEE